MLYFLLALASSRNISFDAGKIWRSGLGRKVRGDHELTSISSWMEVSAKDEAARAAPVDREMNSRGKEDKPEG